MTDYVYDIESYPNVFLITLKTDDNWWTFEISDRKDDIDQIIQIMRVLSIRDDRMVGFNNIGYDYPVLHFTINNRPTPQQIYEKSISIINSTDRFSHIIWDRDQYVAQVDLFKIHHFDNMAKATSLKILEFNMRSASIQELPFPPGTILTSEQIDLLIQYNQHDVNETDKFMQKSLDAIKFRETLSKKYGKNFINFNDTKIGKEYFIQELETKRPGSCFIKGRQPRQTPRDFIRIADIILPHVIFKRPEFERIKQWLASQVVTETKGVFKKLSCTVDDFQFDFGTGGIHGSVEAQTVRSDKEGLIIDVDVEGYYPSLAIANKLYPEHLGETFCDIYADIKKQRKEYKKGSPENMVLKLASNGVFGDTNNPYSSFYDPKYTMAITINGQLLLCLLSERLMEIPGLRMIQANTDGVTVKCPQNKIDQLNSICKWWELYTGLVLEEAIYNRMFIRDVNNYLAEYDNGKLKSKGAYVYQLEWYKNHSSLVIAKAAEAALVHGVGIKGFIHNHKDPMDFLLRTKVPRSSYLLHGDRKVQNVTRYYVSHEGAPLIKMMPPLAGKKDYRKIGINVGWLTTECNNWTGNLTDINYDFYIQETEKLVHPLQ